MFHVKLLQKESCWNLATCAESTESSTQPRVTRASLSLCHPSVTPNAYRTVMPISNLPKSQLRHLRPRRRQPPSPLRLRPRPRHPSTDPQRCPSQRPRLPRRPHWRSSLQVHAPTLPAAGTVPTPPTRIPPSSPRLPPPPIHAFPHPRRRPTAPILPDGATRPAPAPPDAQPYRAAPPDAQPDRAASPHTVPRANPKWIRMPGAIRAPPPPLPSPERH